MTRAPGRSLLLAGVLFSCGPSGTAWVTESPPAEPWGEVSPDVLSTGEPRTQPGTDAARSAVEGRSLGIFRNTYYDFPNETDFEGPLVPLKDAGCRTLERVPQAFYESVCVQGSGRLASGSTASFAARDCSCAESCPGTGERICFEQLDPSVFPWGRGAMGTPITPLLTVAVDSDVIPLGTVLYIPELDGLPRDALGSAAHDGCFLAEDRGSKVRGKHVDVFTGGQAVTALWNRLVPSNQGVNVVLDAERCSGLGGT